MDKLAYFVASGGNAYRILRYAFGKMFGESSRRLSRKGIEGLRSSVYGRSLETESKNVFKPHWPDPGEGLR